MTKETESPSAGAKPREIDLPSEHPGQQITIIGPNASGKFFRVSTVVGPWAWETMVFECKEGGAETDWMDLVCYRPPDHEAGKQFAREA